jgi:hypothetical protein
MISCGGHKGGLDGHSPPPPPPPPPSLYVKKGPGCCNKSDTVMIQQEFYKVDDTRLLQYCYIMTVSYLLEQPCNKLDNINKVVTTC